MKNRKATIDRKTKETDIQLTLDLDSREVSLDLPLPFFVHMLNAMAHHGGFGLSVRATGDIEVDPHHLVEDLGIVLGQAFAQIQKAEGPLARYGHSIIPMDDALSEAVVDACNRAYLVYNPSFPQPYSGSFDMSLFREFFLAFAANARVNLHLSCRYGLNSHHMIESLFKAVGRALAQAFARIDSASGPISTKGSL